MKKIALVLALTTAIAAPSAFADPGHGQAKKAQHQAIKAEKKAIKADQKASRALEIARNARYDSRYDHDRDGLDDRDEARYGEDYVREDGYVNSRRPQFPGNPRAPAYGRRAQDQLVLDRFDVNRDGVLSRYEQDRASDLLRQQRINRDRGLPGYRADRNGDGYISAEEHRLVRAQMVLEEALARYIIRH